MTEPVNEKECDEICIGAVKELALLARFFEIKKYLPFVFIERKREDICRVIFFAIGAVELTRLFGADNDKRALVLWAKYGSGHFEKRQAGELAFCSVRDGEHTRWETRGTIGDRRNG